MVGQWLKKGVNYDSVGNAAKLAKKSWLSGDKLPERYINNSGVGAQKGESITTRWGRLAEIGGENHS